MIKKLIAGFVGATLIVPAALVMTGMAAQEAPCGGTEQILATIRTVESGNNYQAQNGSASASGAYQMIDTTWAKWAAVTGADVATYPSAHLAPPAAQDAAARAHVEDILTRQAVEAIPVIWYYPKALGDPVAMAQVPPYPGNKLTVAEYQAKWLAEYSSAECATTATASGEWAMPVDAPPAELLAPHHDYPAVDIGIPTGTPVRAMHAGTVSRVTDESGNCWGDRDSCSSICGIGASITDGDVIVSYCHLERRDIALGELVSAGQLIGSSGNTGRSSGPHLHLGITVAGDRRCPQPILRALIDGTEIPNPATLTTDCVSGTVLG